jgi:hypothetical protein
LFGRIHSCSSIIKDAQRDKKFKSKDRIFLVMFYGSGHKKRARKGIKARLQGWPEEIKKQRWEHPQKMESELLPKNWTGGISGF